jgi:hypothetical protein
MIKLLLLLTLLTDPKGKLPSRTLSPGEVGSTDTAAFCHSAYTKAERQRETSAIKREVYRRYGMVADTSTVVDHVIPLELGGKSSVLNSFPQKHPWDRSKDSLENKLHRLVCQGKYPVKKAQARIASNWYRLWLEVKKL